MIYEILLILLPLFFLSALISGIKLLRGRQSAEQQQVSQRTQEDEAAGNEELLYPLPADETPLRREEPQETIPERKPPAVSDNSLPETPSETDEPDPAVEQEEEPQVPSPPESELLPAYPGRQRAVRAAAGEAASSETPEKETHQDTFETRLKKELLFSEEHGYDVSLALIRLRFRDKSKAPESMPLYAKVIYNFLGNSAYIYQYKESIVKNSYACIMPFANFTETQKELLSLFRHIKEDLEAEGIVFSCGYTSRLSRRLEPELFLHEASVSLKKALQRKGFSLIGFEPDADTFDTNLQS